MQAEWSAAIAPNAPSLTVPWQGELGRDGELIAYIDLLADPSALAQIPEAAQNAPLAEALARLNAPASPFATAKCDAWPLDREDLAALDLLLLRDDASRAGHGSYIDIYLRNPKDFASRERHVALLEALTLSAVALEEPDASAEFVLRAATVDGQEGHAITVFIYGLGEGMQQAERAWAAALLALANLLLQAQ